MQVFMRTAFSAAAIAALSVPFAHAQQTLAPVVVSANPLGADINDLITPVCCVAINCHKSNQVL